MKKKSQTKEQIMTHSPLTKLAALLFAVLSTLAYAQDLSWYTTQSSPYSISTADELKGLQSLVANNNNFNGKTILLANDISLSGNWTPIGNGTLPFQGVFDGQGYTISGLSVNVSNYAGLFGLVGTNGQIKNVNVIATTIKGGGNAGVLVGYYDSSKPIENCSAKGDVTLGNTSADSTSSGGLVGRVNAAVTITNSYASGDISSDNSNYSGSGGLVGKANAALTIINSSYASGNVSSKSIASVKNNYAYSGGLVGETNSTLTIINSYASGNIFSTAANSVYSGGLVGKANSNLTITNSFASGNITTLGTNKGGLVGYLRGRINITNSYVSGNVQYGIFGYCNVTGSQNSIANVYYNSEGASQAAFESNISVGIFALTSDNLKKKNNFIGWDFNEIWGIVEGSTYPYLKIYPPTDVYIPINGIEAEYIFDQTYTGSPITPGPKIKLNGTLLTKGTDYLLYYQNNENAGTGKIIISSSMFIETMTFNILPKTLTITDAAAQNKVYDGTTTATITGTLQGVAEGDDVALGTSTFADKNAGTGKAVAGNITLTGTSASNYKLTQPTGLTADITKKPLAITLEPKTITVAKSGPLPTFSNYLVYDGLIERDVIGGTTNVYRGSTQLTTVPAVGIYPITLSGVRTNDNYAFSYDNEELYLEVIADPVNLSTCTIDIPAQTYTGSQIQPTISVTCDTATLTEDDYTIAYGANINAGTTAGTVTLTGKGAYTGTKTGTFAIDKKALTVTGAAAENKTYDGTTAATITGAELEGVIGTDAVSLANHTAGTFASANAGEDIAVSTNMSLTGTGAGNYSVTQPSDLKASITPKALPADAIQAIAAQTHTGSGITPAITVKDGSSTLASGTDYTAEFADNIDVGTATVIVTGKGNYSGTATANFAINARPSSSSAAVTPSSSSATPSSSSGNITISSSSTTQLSSSGNGSPSSSSATQQPSSSTTQPSSSSTTPPSSSGVTPSSSSNGSTPIRLPQIAAANQATLIRNGISLHATSKAVVEVYGLNGNLVSRQNFGNGVYTVSYEHLPKGMYIVKVSYGSEKHILRLPVR
jgi:hypothetical protein